MIVTVDSWFALSWAKAFVCLKKGDGAPNYTNDHHGKEGREKKNPKGQSIHQQNVVVELVGSPWNFLPSIFDFFRLISEEPSELTPSNF